MKKYGSPLPPLNKKLKKVIVTFSLTILTFFLAIARYKLAIASYKFRIVKYKVRIVRYKLAILRTGVFFTPSKLDFITQVYISQEYFFHLQYWLFFSQLRLYISQLWLYNSQLQVYISQFLLYNSQLPVYISQFWLYEYENELYWPGMFTHTRNLLLWQKLHSAEWQQQDKTDYKRITYNNTCNVQNNKNTIARNCLLYCISRNSDFITRNYKFISHHFDFIARNCEFKSHNSEKKIIVR